MYGPLSATRYGLLKVTHYFIKIFILYLFKIVNIGIDDKITEIVVLVIKLLLILLFSHLFTHILINYIFVFTFFFFF